MPEVKPSELPFAYEVRSIAAEIAFSDLDEMESLERRQKAAGIEWPEFLKSAWRDKSVKETEINHVVKWLEEEPVYESICREAVKYLGGDEESTEDVVGNIEESLRDRLAVYFDLHIHNDLAATFARMIALDHPLLKDLSDDDLRFLLDKALEVKISSDNLTLQEARMREEFGLPPCPNWEVLLYQALKDDVKKNQALQGKIRERVAPAGPEKR